MMKLVVFYQKFISVIIKTVFGGGCRFEPTCSEYSKIALRKYGMFTGSWLSLKRVLKCHPWGGFGYDPVP